MNRLAFSIKSIQATTVNGTLWVSVVVLTLLLSGARGQCYNHCSGHGECNKYGQCECWGGYGGWDCSFLACPSAPAWTDLAVATDDAHNDAVCSNMGYCDRRVGIMYFVLADTVR